MTCSRRTIVLGVLGAGVGACGVPFSRADSVAGPADSGGDDAEAHCTRLSADEKGRAVAVPWADVPALEARESFAVVERPGELLNVWVHRDDAGCLSAVWRVCTHGACEVAPTETSPFEYACPCHGSRFALDGSVIHGPATRPLRSFRVETTSDGLLIGR